MNNLLKNIFSIDTKSSNRIIIRILGFKIQYLKKSVINAGNKYKELDCPVSEIPPAEGVLRKIQLGDLKLLQIFDKICQENGLSYWLDFGNLLGAVRHKGFIPWDDDVDVSMLREDYEKLFKLFKDGFPGYDDLYIKFINNGYSRCLMKILHKKIPYLQIDVFPYDLYYEKVENDSKKSLTKLLKQLHKNKKYMILSPFLRSKDDFIISYLKKVRDEKILKNNNVDKGLTPAIFYGIDYPHKHPCQFFDWEDIFPLGKINYENIELSCPNNPQKVAKQIFGDSYMELPKNCYPRHSNSFEISEEIDKSLNEFIKGE